MRSEKKRSANGQERTPARARGRGRGGGDTIAAQRGATMVRCRRVGERRLKERTFKPAAIIHERKKTGIKREVSLEYRMSRSAAGTVGAVTFTPRVYIPSRDCPPHECAPSLPSISRPPYLRFPSSIMWNFFLLRFPLAINRWVPL